MPADLTPTLSINLLILAFILGFALATLIFCPMLHRAQQHAAARRAKQPPRPVSRPPLAKAPADSRTAETGLAKSRAAGSEAAQAAPAKSEPPATGSESANAETAPVHLGDLPKMPTGLYQEHHAEQFEHTRARLERLRAQLKNW